MAKDAGRVVAVRHGKYEGESLTDEGVAVQTEMSKRLQAEGISADQIITSPLTRAVETAEILQEYLGGTLSEEPALNDFEDEVVLSHIQSGKTTVLVGHDPTLAAFINRLLGRARFTGLSKSSAVVLEFPKEISWGAAELIAYHQMG